MLWIIIGIVVAFVFGFLVGRNNPNLAAVNNLIRSGEAIVDKTGQVISAVKKTV